MKKKLAALLCGVMCVTAFTGCSRTELAYLNMSRELLDTMSSCAVEGSMQADIDFDALQDFEKDITAAVYGEGYEGVESDYAPEGKKSLKIDYDMNMNLDTLEYDMSFDVNYNGKSYDLGKIYYSMNQGVYATNDTLWGMYQIYTDMYGKTDQYIVSEAFAEDLRNTYNISLWLLLVPVLTGVLIARKVSAIATLFIAAVIAGVAAILFQPHVIGFIADPSCAGSGRELSFVEGFKGLSIMYYGATSVDTGNEALNSLVSTRGMTGMLSTVFLIITASCFGGTLVGSGMLQSLTDALVRFVHKRVSMVASTVGTGIFANMITGDQYLSIILTSNLYKKLYKERRYESKLLSRSVEDSATVVSVLIPWNSCGMTQSTVLKVSTLHYLPYCFFNLLSPLMSIFVAMIGYKIKRTEKVEKA